jgi:hypothetical protein
VKFCPVKGSISVDGLEEASLLANIDEFRVLLERYEDDPGVCSKLLRTYALSQPKIFLTYAQTILLERPVTRALKFLATLTISAGIVQVLLEMYLRDRNTAIALSKKIAQCDPRFDTQLADHILRPANGVEPEDAVYCTVLDLLDVVSEGDRLVPHILKLLRNANSKIRSKAALFVGSRTQNLAWATTHSQEFDGRVRANILESLFGLNSDTVQQLFRNHIEDENNRCRGNALIGLYRMGDVGSIPLIYNMAKHPEPRFRNTCAWLMGQTGDSRFLSTLAELMKDSDDIVRSQAFKGMAEVKRSIRASQSRPQLEIAIARVLETQNRWTAIATVHDAQDRPVKGLPGVNFISKVGSPSRLIRSFSVEEFECRGTLSVAFVIGVKTQDDAAVDRYLKIIEHCVPLRRSKDRWGAIKLACELGAARPAGDQADFRSKYTVLNVAAETPIPFNPRFEYSAHQHRLTGVAADPVVRLAQGSEKEEASLLVGQLLRSDVAAGKPHVIFLGGAPPATVLESFRERGADCATLHFALDFAVHDRPDLLRSAHETAGSYRIVAEAELGTWCRKICSSLIHHYRVSSTESLSSEGSILELELNASAGRGTAQITVNEVQTRSALTESISYPLPAFQTREAAELV